MELKTFKKNLDAYGADFARWEGIDEGEARAFLKESSEAQKLYGDAAKLDKALETYRVEAPLHSIMGAVNSRIGGAAAMAGGKVAPFPLRINTPSWKVAMGMGALAAAVAIMLVFSTIRNYAPEQAVPGINKVAEMISDPKAQKRQVDAFVTEMASLMDEDVQIDEILGMLEVAQAATAEALPPPTDAEDVDVFLDEIYEASEDFMIEKAAPAASRGDDIWDMFYPSSGGP